MHVCRVSVHRDATCLTPMATGVQEPSRGSSVVSRRSSVVDNRGPGAPPDAQADGEARGRRVACRSWVVSRNRGIGTQEDAVFPEVGGSGNIPHLREWPLSMERGALRLCSLGGIG